MSEVAVPSGWRVATITDMATSVGGGTPSKSDATYWSGGTVPWVSPKDMKVFLVSDSSDKVSISALEQLTLIPERSVLVVVRSGILSRTLPVAVSQRVVTINQDMRAFVPSAGIDARYIAWQFVSKEREILDSCAKDGTTVASIEGPALAAYPLLLAPSAEQTRIVEKLEELLSDVDAGVVELMAAQRKLAQYRQALLKAAVEGTLTVDWRAARAQTGEQQEAGAELLHRILIERRVRWEANQLAHFAGQDRSPPKNWQLKYKDPVAPDIADLPTLPEGWVWASVDQLCPDDISNGRSVRTAENGAKILRLTAVKDGHIDVSEHKIGAWTDDEAKPFAITDGDLLVVRGNGSLPLMGRLGLVRRVSEQVAYPDTMIRVRVLDAVVLPDWVASCWDTSYTRTHLEGRARTSAGIYKISQPDIISVPIPVPPIDEQSEILSLLSRSDEAINSTKCALRDGIRHSSAQRKNILKSAFAGKLVPQDSSDEPASLLLERIRAERAASGKTVTRGRKPRTTE